MLALSFKIELNIFFCTGMKDKLLCECLWYAWLKQSSCLKNNLTKGGNLFNDPLSLMNYKKIIS